VKEVEEKKAIFKKGVVGKGVDVGGISVVREQKVNTAWGKGIGEENHRVMETGGWSKRVKTPKKRKGGGGFVRGRRTFGGG